MSFGTSQHSTIYELSFLRSVTGPMPGAGGAVAAWRESFFFFGARLHLARNTERRAFRVLSARRLVSRAITLQRDAMEHIVELLRDITERKAEFGLVPTHRDGARPGGVSGHPMFLGAQLVGVTVITDLPQQLDRADDSPRAQLRADSECRWRRRTSEFLMTIPNPSPRSSRPIEDAMKCSPRNGSAAAVNPMTNKGPACPERRRPDLGRGSTRSHGKPLSRFGSQIHYLFGEDSRANCLPVRVGSHGGDADIRRVTPRIVGECRPRTRDRRATRREDNAALIGPA